MNHLAHVFLAPDSPEARVGSILGDFTRGVELSALPGEVHRGVRHHFSVDTFTDRHPQVLASKRLFSSQRRRFAGVALDILYDHFLLKHWYRFSDHDCDRFIERTYRELNENRHLMPPQMARVTARMVDYDWFGAYQDLENIGQALDRVASRIRFANRFEGMIEEIHDHRPELEERFLEFFPDLQSIAKGF
ncbi:acyl carrier protein phosphodiesterase [Marinobacter pelagius]|uniref:Acyl carrier protein phosphodiesterase n=1 Tax=Marinobacter pelagius TaxID=379482 RepID=A0A1I4ZJD7_9GAMM|nr:ACP phosphodiesterase [Marinobacter pelagius]SFN50385.1 Acyl carrier protein phosphodiesterase [Marinobacter pelagius]